MTGGIRIGLACCAVLAAGIAAPAVTGRASASSDAIVRSSAGLTAVLQSPQPPRVIHIAAGEYVLQRTLTVPDGVALEGDGAMALDSTGSPIGLDPARKVVLRADVGFDGPVVALGNGTRIRGLRIVDDREGGSSPGASRGNVVQVGSRRPHDVIEATVEECEIIANEPAGFAPDGPTGHGLVVATLNPALGNPPAPHEGARIEVALRHSIIVARDAAAIFAANFAARGVVSLDLERNRLTNTLVGAGGVNRPDKVSAARVDIRSRGNRYTASDAGGQGWLLLGGSTPSHYSFGTGGDASRNLLRMDSSGDSIVGFRLGIFAAGGRRVGAGNAPVSANRLELNLSDASIESTGESPADVELRGAMSEVEQGGAIGDFSPGEGNVIEVHMRGVRGSGRRANVYADVSPESPASVAMSDGNRIRFDGTPESFASSNPGIVPAPSPQFFDLER